MRHREGAESEGELLGEHGGGEQGGEHSGAAG
mgnify:CR=1 FL=1